MLREPQLHYFILSSPVIYKSDMHSPSNEPARNTAILFSRKVKQRNNGHEQYGLPAFIVIPNTAVRRRDDPPRKN